MGSRILIVEDDPEMQDMMRTILHDSGYSVRACPEGNSALKALREFKPDLLLLDVMLPGMDGYTLAQKIISDEETGNIPIVVLSALNPAEVMFRTLPQVVDFLPKPFPAALLLETVKKVLKP